MTNKYILHMQVMVEADTVTEAVAKLSEGEILSLRVEKGGKPDLAFRNSAPVAQSRPASLRNPRA